jgi:hypothetical protein
MAPRRGVVQSDDEDDVRVPSAADIPNDLPVLGNLTAEDMNKIRLLEQNNVDVSARLVRVMTMISDTAVAVEELEVTKEHTETVNNLDHSLRNLIDLTQHVEHSAQAILRVVNTGPTEQPVCTHSPCKLISD